MIGAIDLHATADELAAYVADWLIARAAAADAPVRVALSGGSTPKKMFALLAQPDRARRMKWEKLQIFWGDERLVPYESADSNYGEACRRLLDHVPLPREQIYPFPVDLAPDEAAARYATTLQQIYGATVLDPARPLFSVNFLGLGDDGHTASIIPGQPIAQERVLWAAAVGAGRPEVRLTLTYPVLESARTVAFLVTGSAKAPIFGRIRHDLAEVPAAWLRPHGETFWFVDQAVMGADPST